MSARMSLKAASANDANDFQPGPTAQETTHVTIAGLKARFMTRAFSPHCFSSNFSWAVGPGCQSTGPLALSHSPLAPLTRHS